MNILERKPRAQSQRPSPDSMQAASATIVHNSTGIQPGGLRVHWPGLNDADAAELVALTNKLRASQSAELRGPRLSKREVATWEGLVERGAGQPGIFGKVRDDAKREREWASLAAQAAARPFSRKEQKTLLSSIAKDVAGDAKEGPYITAADWGLLANLLVAFQTGRGLSIGSRVETTPAGPVYCFEKRIGPIGFELDEHSVFSRWQQSLEQLSLNGWVEIIGSGLEWRIAPGWALLECLDGPS